MCISKLRHGTMAAMRVLNWEGATLDTEDRAALILGGPREIRVTHRYGRGVNGQRTSETTVEVDGQRRPPLVALSPSIKGQPLVSAVRDYIVREASR